MQNDESLCQIDDKTQWADEDFNQGVFIYRRADETTKKFGYIWL